MGTNPTLAIPQKQLEDPLVHLSSSSMLTVGFQMGVDGGTISSASGRAQAIIGRSLSAGPRTWWC
jgi:hypothetical protein